jgi:hypothetical protein
MRAPRFPCLLVLSLLGQAPAFAQSADPAPVAKSAEEVEVIKQRAAEWLTTCLRDWDAQTHMSKTEWRTTCERVSKEREQFLLNTPGAISIGERKLR